MTDRLRRMNGGPVLDLLRRDTPVRVAGGTVIAAVLGAGWWELLFLPLGASHNGRINGRFGLVVRNFVEGGLPGSDYLASMAPFSSDPYVHHPPLMNILHAAVGSVLGQGEWQLHAIGYAAGLGTVAGLLWLAGELDLGAGVSVVVMALVAATPMFWIYARLGLGVSIMVVFLALWYRHRRMGGSHGVLLVAAGLTALSSWMGAALIVLASGSGMREGPYRRRAMAVGAVGLAMVALALFWALAVGDAGELAGHTRSRLRWPGWAGLVDNYEWFYGTLFPWWFRWMIVPAVVVALVDRRTRGAAGAILVALGVWTLAAPAAAYVHDYWTYPLLVPVFLGLAVILDRIAGRFDGEPVVIGAALALVLLAVAGFARLAPYRDAYFRSPSDAGALLRETAPASGQTMAWVVEGVDPVPRWVSYYWDLPVTELNDDTVEAVAVTDLILVRLDRLPSWMADPDPVARKGRYALVSGVALHRRE